MFLAHVFTGELAIWSVIEYSQCKTLRRDTNDRALPLKKAHEERYYNTRQIVLSTTREIESKCCVWKRFRKGLIEKMIF